MEIQESLSKDTKYERMKRKYLPKPFQILKTPIIYLLP
jgi:hypothetical protein